MNWKTSKLLQPCDVDTNLFQILWMCHCLAMLEMANRNTEWIWVSHCWSLPEKRWRRCWMWWRVVIELIKLPMVRNKIFWSWLLVSVPDFLWFWSPIFVKALKKKQTSKATVIPTATWHVLCIHVWICLKCGKLDFQGHDGTRIGAPWIWSTIINFISWPIPWNMLELMQIACSWRLKMWRSFTTVGRCLCVRFHYAWIPFLQEIMLNSCMNPIIWTIIIIYLCSIF